jgi:hypothetical protein
MKSPFHSALPLLALAGGALGTNAAHASESVHLFTSDPERLANRRLWVELGLPSDFGFRLKGVSAQIGFFASRLFTVDLRVSTASTSYGGIRARADYDSSGTAGADYASSTDPTSELNRPRNRDDSWKLTLIEPGVGVRSRMFVDWLPLLSEHARFGLARAGLTDEANSIGFSGWIPSFEAGFDYALGRGSPWSLGAALSYHGGLVTSTAPERDSNVGTLPVSWLGLSANLRYSF